jgi:MAternally-affected-uncoordination protein
MLTVLPSAQKFNDRTRTTGRKSINFKMASSQDAWYLSLLGLAENFRTSSPPNIKLCIQCLQAVFNFKPPPRVEARTHLQLGNILLTHTKNIDLARTHLEQAV